MITGLKIEKVTLTPEGSACILETAVSAGRHGIANWARVIRADYDDPDRGGLVRALHLVDDEGQGEKGCEPDHAMLGVGGERLRGEEDEDDGEPGDAVLVVTRDAIERAVQKMLAEYDDTDSPASHLVDYLDVDEPLADAIVQVACFGKVIYG